MADIFETFRSELADHHRMRPAGRVSEVAGGVLRVLGLNRAARLGDRVEIRSGRVRRSGEAVALGPDGLRVLVAGPAEGIGPGDLAMLLPDRGIAPGDDWLGRIVDPAGRPLDGRPLAPGPVRRSLRAPAPAAAQRRPPGGRLDTGLAAFDTFLPLVRGQRIGLFAGSGVGKSMLLADLARGVKVDVTVAALIGERGREVRAFADGVLGPSALARSVVIAATSDQPALVRRRAAWAALTVAEHFRDAGAQVLLLMDSVTRFAEAHRDIALAAGEAAGPNGFPPSTGSEIAALAERCGPGASGGGDITAVLSVLVAGSDMDEPVADMLRGTLDGHVVLDRAIAERGRFPAIDLLRSVSRSLPDAADKGENELLLEGRRLLAVHERAELMVQSGLYAAGSDPSIDAALRVWPGLDAFLALPSPGGVEASFAALRAVMAAAEPGGGVTGTRPPPQRAAPAASAGGGRRDTVRRP